MVIRDTNKREEYYKAVKERDNEYIGTFFFAVKTTGIFCIPGCRARTPKADNIEYSNSSKELLDLGYRPCNICEPTAHAFEPPIEIKKALDLINKDLFEKVSDQKLRDNDLIPENIRRWFKKNHGMTFQAYQRMLRINTAFQNLKNGNQVTDAAYTTGYNSLSGFNYTFKNLLGSSPVNSQNKKVILIDRITTPLGPMFICSSETGICLLEFSDRKMLETEIHNIQEKFNAVILAGENEHIKLAKKQLDEYFLGIRKEFSVSLDLCGTPFSKEVWQRLMKIPYGETISYNKLSKEISAGDDIKIVVRANGLNSIAIIIPCHRIVTEEGDLKGYGGGLKRKEWLIRHEWEKSLKK